MFSHHHDNSLSTGRKNVRAAKKYLKDKGIKIVGEDTGGNTGRKIVFSLKTGTIKVEKRI